VLWQSGTSAQLFGHRPFTGRRQARQSNGVGLAERKPGPLPASLSRARRLSEAPSYSSANIQEKENRDLTTGARRQLWCYAIAAKRYTLFNRGEDGRPLLRKSSEHGLGHQLSPTDPFEEDDEGDKADDADAADHGDGEEDSRKGWIRTIWEGIATEALDQPDIWPDWLDRPALGRIAATSPEMLRPFKTLNQGKPYARQVKPYNFLLTAYVQRFGHPEGVDPARFHLVAPFESDPRKWGKLPWVNLYDDQGTRYQVTTKRSEYAVLDVVYVKTYRDVLDEYRAHAETKSLAPDGSMCSGSTIGLLWRRPVTALYLTHVGKESNRLEEVEAGLVHDPDEVYTTYHDPEHEAWQTLVVPVLKQMPRRRLMEQSGLDRSSITRIRTGHRVPHHAVRDGLIHMAAEISRAGLQARGMRIPPG
jgi:hypothetical protein